MSLGYKIELGHDDLVIDNSIEGLTLSERQDADVARANAMLHELGSSALASDIEPNHEN